MGTGNFDGSKEKFVDRIVTFDVLGQAFRVKLSERCRSGRPVRLPNRLSEICRNLSTASERMCPGVLVVGENVSWLIDYAVLLPGTTGSSGTLPRPSRACPTILGPIGRRETKLQALSSLPNSAKSSESDGFSSLKPGLNQKI